MNILNAVPQAIIGLSPMDGVTDAAYRFIQKKYGNPDVMFTEFTHVMGLVRGAAPLFVDQLFVEQERPIIAQIYGATPEDFYHSAKIIAALDFDGIDINMGCPAKNVTDSGCGAALIRTPDLAKQIVLAVKRGIHDYLADGQLTGVTANVPELIKQNWDYRQRLADLTQAELLSAQQIRQQEFTVSVKTRIGYSENTVTEWLPQIAETNPDWISVHGRTLKQMYTGQADWEAMATAVHSTSLPVLVNGDITTPDKAVQVLKQTGARGVLVGRGSYGNPWFFQTKVRIKALEYEIPEPEPTREERLTVMLEHAQLHWELKGERAFVQMRKNFGWYCKGFDGAAELRAKLFQTTNLEQVKDLLR